MKKRFSHWFYAITAMVLYAQSAAVLHAMEHEFHAPSEICAVYSVVEHNSLDDKLVFVTSNFTIDSNDRHDRLHSVNILYAHTHLYPIRAPPLL